MSAADREFMLRAACANLPTSIFYPDTASGRETVYDAAKRICVNCDVRSACLDFAWPRRTGNGPGFVMSDGKMRQLGVGEEFGAWAGTTPKDRGFGKMKAKDAEPGDDPCANGCGRLILRVGVKKYCGEACQRAAARVPKTTEPHLELGPEIRNCAYCGGRFERVRTGQRHCSTDCVRNALMGRSHAPAEARPDPVGTHLFPVTTYTMPKEDVL